jgi:hypothetical protein
MNIILIIDYTTLPRMAERIELSMKKFAVKFEQSPMAPRYLKDQIRSGHNLRKNNKYQIDTLQN